MVSQQERRVERSERLLRDEEEKRKKLETKVAAAKREKEASELASTSAEAIGKELDDALKARDAAKRESEDLKNKVRDREKNDTVGLNSACLWLSVSYEEKMKSAKQW